MEPVENQSKIRKKDIDDILALTPLQEGILFHYLKDPQSKSYREELRINLSGTISIPAFEGAWQHIVQSNEILRTVFRWDGLKQPVQIVLRTNKLKIIYSDREPTNDEEAYNFQSVPFSIELCRTAEHEYQLILRHHHILYDGWSNGILLYSFFKIYHEMIEGMEIKVGDKKKYSDFIKWLQQRNDEGSLQFWNDYLSGLTEQTRFTIRSAREAGALSSGKYEEKLNDQLCHDLRLFARNQNVTLASIFYAAWGLLLQRYKNADDVLFGTTVSGRNCPVSGIEEMIGLFINTLPLRIKTHEGQTVAQLLHNVHHDMQRRSAHESTSLVDVKATFDTIVVVENYPLDVNAFAKGDQSAALRVVDYEASGTTNYDLTVNVECFDSIKINISWSEGLFDKEAVQRIAEHFILLLGRLIASPDQNAGRLNMHRDDELRALVNSVYNREMTYPSVTIHEEFERRAQLHPDHTALSFENQTLSYGELSKKSNAVANILRSEGVVHPNFLVAVMMNRSIDLIVTVLGVLKAGGVYVPIDHNYPEDRISYILEDSGASLLITTTEHSTKCEGGYKQLLFDVLNLDEHSHPVERVDIRPDHLAYVIYTSGTTGQPKGVLIEHQNVVQLILHEPNKFQFFEKDIWVFFHSFCFDVSVWEIFGALLTGGRLVIPTEELVRDSWAFVDLLIKEKVTVLSQTPSAFYLLLEALKGRPKLPLCIRKVIFAGEMLKPGLLQDWYKHYPETQLLNLYGITETTVHATYKEISEHDIAQNRSMIGRALPTYSCYVMDYNKRLVPVGRQGELYVGGAGVARGYLNRPELTSESFIDNPYRPGERLYKSGDLVYLLENGEMEYVGRADHQVKIRGYRIETGEIEFHLQQHPKCRDVLVLALPGNEGVQYLCAYVLSHSVLSAKDLRSFLVDKVPSYMMPDFFVLMDHFPLTPNGKVDRRALPKPGGDRTSVNLLPEMDEVERIIATIWKEVLENENIRLSDNFFDAGGNSLKMIRLLSRLKGTFDKDITIPLLFRYPNIQDQAAYFKETAKKASDAVTVENKSDHLDHDVAIIGMALRAPGASDIEQYWSNLANGIESIHSFTDEELLQAGIQQELIDKKNYVKAKGYLKDADAFDYRFFDYSLKEAEVMDPQLRILHECAWEALEHAGEAAESSEKNVGVYVGASPNYYWLRGAADRNENALNDFQTMLLNEKDFFATRLAYKLNLRGPAVTVQTACSTSLVAIHQAWTDLTAGRCNMALAGGVSITYPIMSGYQYEDGMVHSPDGHCRAFDELAQGTVPGNGSGVVVLKRLKDAFRDGNTIFAVIKGSAINNDGAGKAGFTAPSVEGQAMVIKQGLATAGLHPANINYIEAHGTGTALGDPIELDALRLAYQSQGAQGILIGSVKTNIGHLDAAAGVAGFIKAVLSVYNKQIPPSLNYKNPNSMINFGDGLFKVNTSLRPWNEQVRRAGISSFGMGGTNAHIVIESAPLQHLKVTSNASKHRILTISAKTESALKSARERLAEFLENASSGVLADTAYTLHYGRRSFPYRCTVVAANTEEAVAKLRLERTGTKQADERLPIMFLFPGQGSQYVNMCRDLYENEPYFREQMDDGLIKLSNYLDFNPISVLFPGEGEEEKAAELIKHTSLAQPLLFLVEHGVASLLIQYGIRPKAMLGHSIGEYVAACLSGVMTFDDALRVVIERGRLMQSVCEGAMVSISLPEEEVQLLLSAELELAAVNSPKHTVVSGPFQAVDVLEKKLTMLGVKYVRLKTSHAFHSMSMTPVMNKFVEFLSDVVLMPPKTPFISNLTGEYITADQATSPHYWADQMRKVVLFDKGLSRLLNTERAVFIEIGPGHALTTFLRSNTHYRSSHVSFSTIRHALEQMNDSEYLLNEIAKLWAAGCKVEWGFLYRDEERLRIPLPLYDFEKQRLPSNPFVNGEKIEKQGAGEKQKQANMDEWFYLPSWKRVPITRNDGERRLDEQEIWLLFMDRLGTAEAVISRMKGHTYVRVETGENFSWENDTFSIRPHDNSDYMVMFEELRKRGLLPTRIFHAWSLNGVESMTAIKRADHALKMGYHSLMNLSQAMSKYGISEARLFVVTDRMLEVTGTEETLHPEQATVLGFSKLCAVEMPGLTCKVIDIESGSLSFNPENIVREFARGTEELLVAYRANYQWIPEYVSSPTRAALSLNDQVKSDGVYLITGGLGGIGLAIAQGLSTVHASVRLVLINRSEFPPREQWNDLLHDKGLNRRTQDTIHALLSMEKCGADILVLQADVAKESEMAAVLKVCKTRFGQINGVIHAAGVADYHGIMLHRSQQQNEQILSPKVMGTLILDELLKNEPIDFMVLCSSIGNITYHQKFGQSAYNAANEFLDAFAYFKTKRDGIHTVSVNWPDWQEVGMSLKSAEKWAEQLNISIEEVLYDGLSVEEGVEVFKRALGRTDQQVIVSPVDLAWKIKHGARYYSELLRDRNHKKMTNRSKVIGLPSIAPSNEIEQKIIDAWKEMFGFEEVEVNDNFFDIGMNSLDLVRLNAKLKELFECDLSVVTLYEHSTISAIAKHIHQISMNSDREIMQEDNRRTTSSAIMRSTLAKMDRP